MDNQDSGGMVEEKPCILSLSAAIETYSSVKRREEYQLMEATEELEMLQQRKLTDAIEFTACTILSKNGGEDDDFDDFYETQSYTLICRLCEKFHESIKSIMDQRMVAVAFEGQNLGRNGVLSLVQIVTDSELIIFDMIRLGDEAFKAGLQSVFESEDIMKVIHDCRWIADLLRFQHNISMANIFDTQVANAFVHRSLNGGKWPKYVESLSDCLISYLNLPPHDIHYSQISEENEVIWLVRPLPLDLLDSATKNAVHLLKLQRVLLAEMLAEFKAAVDLYLNLTYGAGDFKKCQMTSRLLPGAFMYIHTYIQNKSGGCSSKSRPKRAKNNLQSSEKVKISCISEKGASGNKTSVPLHSERENISTKMVESSTKYSQEKTAEIDCAVAVSPSGDNDDDAGSFLCNEDVVPGEDVSYPASPNGHVSQTVSLSDKNFSPREIAAPSDTLEVGAIEMESVLPPCGPPRQEKEELKAKQLKQVEDLPASAAVTKKKLTDHLEQPIVIRINYPILPLHSYSQNQDLSKASVLHPPLTSAKLEVSQPSSKTSKASSGGDHIISFSSSGANERQETSTSKRTEISERSCVETLSGHLHIGYQRCTQEKANQFHVEESNVKNSVKESCPSASNATHNNNIFADDDQSHNQRCFRETVGPFKEKGGTQQRTYKEAFSSSLSSAKASSLITEYPDIKFYQCLVCFKIFDSQRSLNIHKKKHTLSKQFKCDLCNKKFASRTSVKTHLRNHRGEEVCMCEICGREFSSSVPLLKHQKRHMSEKPYKCDVCDRRFIWPSELYYHEKTHSKVRSYKCVWCHKMFRTSGELKNHEVTHSEKKPYECDICGKKFKRQSELLSHTRRKTQGVGRQYSYRCGDCGETFLNRCLARKHKEIHPPYKCDQCMKSFAYESHLIGHKRMHEEKVKRFKCNVCGKMFSKNSKLNAHIIIHSTEKPYKCDECGKSFVHPRYLRGHKIIHSDVKPHMCEICGKCFVVNTSLTKHMKSHSGDRPFKCDVCGKTYPKMQNLNDHKRTHSGHKPYQCNVCDRSFTCLGYLRQHKLTHTGNRPYMCSTCGKAFKRIGHRKIHEERMHSKNKF